MNTNVQIMQFNKYAFGNLNNMRKIRKTTGRGTGSREVDISDQNWAGDAFRKTQNVKKKELDPNTVISLGRGGKTVRLKDLPEPEAKPSTKGITRITGRGTGSRKSKYKGSNQSQE